MLDQSKGAPTLSLIMIYWVIQCMVSFICTTFGESLGSYGGLQDTIFQGTCQGNGASPNIWLLISIYLVLLIKVEGHISQVSSPISGITLKMVGFLFIDETYLVEMVNKDEEEGKYAVDYNNQSIF